MIPVPLARRLRDAGLPWEPTEGDRFILPDRDMDDEVFTISRMVVEVRTAPIGQLIAFNGTTEWALDTIERAGVVWLPREEQLRLALGEALLSLVQAEGRWRCTTQVAGHLTEFEGPTAEEAYGLALLDLLEADPAR